MTAGIVPEVKFKFTNSGSTPAKNQRYVATLEVMDHPAPAPSGDMVAPLDNDLLPTNSLHQAQIGFGDATLPNPLTEDEITAIFISKSKKLYIFGVIYYDDVFGTPHKTRFCSFLTLKEAESGAHIGNWYKANYHNDAD